MIHGPRHIWHVQDMGAGSNILLLHGAGGSVHSFAALLPLLSKGHRVFAPDLPGHGFTRLGGQRRSGLPQMAQDITALCEQENIRPSAIIGHSAGAAIGLHMAQAQPDLRIVGINPALSQFEGLAGILFPAMAKLLAAMPFTAKLFSGTSSHPDRVRKLIGSTGSKLSSEGLELYRTLVSREDHVNGALSMMAQWQLDDLLEALPQITNQTRFITAAYDMTVPARVADHASKRMPNAEVVAITEYGHLIHEENAELVAKHCLDFINAS